MPARLRSETPKTVPERWTEVQEPHKGAALPKSWPWNPRGWAGPQDWDRVPGVGAGRVLGPSPVALGC